MSKKRNITTTNQTTNGGEDEIVNLVEVTEQAQDFYEKHQKTILAVLFGVTLLVGGYLLYKYFYQIPKEKEAVEAMFQAESLFARDSFNVALKSPTGKFEGFLDIIDNYGGTKVANTAHLYAGLCYLNLGKFNDAIEYLDDYDADDDVTPHLKYGALGDAYAENGDLDKAASMYEKAANTNSNDLLTPYYLNKAALLAFSQNKNDKALALYKNIAEKYPNAAEAKEADKFIERLGK